MSRVFYEFTQVEAGRQALNAERFLSAIGFEWMPAPPDAWPNSSLLLSCDGNC